MPQHLHLIIRKSLPVCKHTRHALEVEPSRINYGWGTLLSESHYLQYFNYQKL